MKKLIKFLSVALIGAVLIGCGGGGGSNTPASGSLDKSFGDNGKVITGGSNREDITDIISNSDGSLLITGRVDNTPWNGFLSKLDESGDYVNSFATNGTFINPTTNENRNLAMAKDSSGYIYIVGYINVANKEGFVAKFKPNGTPDTTFANGGVKIIKSSGKDITINAIAIDSNGKLVIGGSFDNDAIVARLKSDGNVDMGFGLSPGTIFGGTHSDIINDIAIEDNGDIIAIGSTELTATTLEIMVAKLNSSGGFVNSFGTSGVMIIPDSAHSNEGTSVALDSNGDIFVTGSSALSMILAKVKQSDGSLDTSFASSGIAKYSDSAFSFGSDLTTDANDNILVTGLVGQNLSSYKMAVWRYDATGNLDTSFNGSGLATYSEGYDMDFGKAITIDDNNKIIVGGGSYQGPSKKSDKAIWRINP